MLDIREKEEKKKPYEYDIYFNNEIISSEAYFDDDNNLYVCESLENEQLFDSLLKTSVAKFPANFQLNVPQLNIKIRMLWLFSVTMKDNNFRLSYYSSFHDIYNSIDWKVKEFYQAICLELESYPSLEYAISNPDYDYANNNIEIIAKFESTEKSIENIINESNSIIGKVIEKTIIRLTNDNWNSDYETDENLFTKEMILPLLSKLGFNQVRYTHGVKEFGKDVIYSKTNEFNQKEYFAVQVKAGNVNGNVKGDINELINQIDDAFKVPFKLVGKASDNYISKLIIAISGRFTENAEIKILHKTNKILLGNIVF